MNNAEFARLVAYVSSATGAILKPERQMVYFELLGDLEFEHLMNGVKLVIMEHKWPSFPSISELREAAHRAASGKVVDDAPEIAWAQAWRAIGRIDVATEGSEQRALESLPEDVVLTIRSLGVTNLIASVEPVSIIRAQFLKAYVGIRETRETRAKLPPKLVDAIEGRAPPPAIAAKLLAIGNGGAIGAQ